MNGKTVQESDQASYKMKSCSLGKGQDKTKESRVCLDLCLEHGCIIH